MSSHFQNPQRLESRSVTRDRPFPSDSTARPSRLIYAQSQSRARPGSCSEFPCKAVNLIGVHARTRALRAEGTLECGSSSCRLPVDVHTERVGRGTHAKAVAAATALRGAARRLDGGCLRERRPRDPVKIMDEQHPYRRSRGHSGLSLLLSHRALDKLAAI